MKRYLVIGALVLAAMLGLKLSLSAGILSGGDIAEKIYVAVEGQGRIAVIDASSNRVVRNIDLGGYSPHNVQVAPDGRSVWVTGNSGMHGHGMRFINTAFAEGAHTGPDMDQVIVIDPQTDRIIQRIPIGSGLHLAHIAVSSDGEFALVSAQVAGLVYRINARTFAVESKVSVGAAAEPHGLRISPDNKTAYVALLKGNGLSVIDAETMASERIPLSGAAVQAGILPDGSYALASIYDKKQIAFVSTKDKAISYADLPEGSKGPLQFYPSNDSRFVYVADQGYYFNQPTGDKIYAVDVVTKNVIGEAAVGQAPHGVVASKATGLVYATNLLGRDVSVIDPATLKEVKRIKVGTEPNGISIWHKDMGGTP